MKSVPVYVNMSEKAKKFYGFLSEAKAKTTKAEADEKIVTDSSEATGETKHELKRGDVLYGY